MARRVLITGGGGLIGSAMCRALVADGDVCVAVGRNLPVGLAAGVRFSLADVRDAAALEPLLRAHAIDTVFHLAGESQVGRALSAPDATFDANVTGTWNVLEAARAAGVGRVVVASSERVYRPASGERLTEDAPLFAADPYGASKVAADVLARSYAIARGLPTATVRLANVYGPGDRNPRRLVPGVVSDVLAGRRPVILSDGSPRHDYIYVDDAVAAYLAVADALDSQPEEARGAAFNVASGHSATVLDVAAVLCALAGTQLTPDVRGAELDGPRLGGRELDCTRVAQLTGWRPRIGFEDGLARTIDGYRAERANARQPARIT